MENEKNSHQVNELMQDTMEKLRSLVDVDTIIGAPIKTEDVTLLPVSRLSLGVACGGSDFVSKNQQSGQKNPFGGGSGAGMNVYPVGFLVVRGQNVRFLPVAVPTDTAAGKLVDMIPEVVDKLSELIKSQKKEGDVQADAQSTNAQSENAQPQI